MSIFVKLVNTIKFGAVRQDSSRRHAVVSNPGIGPAIPDLVNFGFALIHFRFFEIVLCSNIDK